MPSIRWPGVDDVEEAARTVGPRIRELRESRSLTIRELAGRCQISPTTLIRLEQGNPIAERPLQKLCDGLQTILPNLLVSTEGWDRPFRVDRASDSPWRIAFRREKAPSHLKDFDSVSEETERNRLGSVGFVTGFLRSLDCKLRRGKFEAAVVELHGNQEKPGYRHSGEEFIYCLQGRLRLTIAKETIILEPGDAVTFLPRFRHRYESDIPSKAGIAPTRILMVWQEGEEDELSRLHDDECLI